MRIRKKGTEKKKGEQKKVFHPPPVQKERPKKKKDTGKPGGRIVSTNCWRSCNRKRGRKGGEALKGRGGGGGEKEDESPDPILLN